MGQQKKNQGWSGFSGHMRWCIQRCRQQGCTLVHRRGLESGATEVQQLRSCSIELAKVWLKMLLNKLVQQRWIKPHAPRQNLCSAVKQTVRFECMKVQVVVSSSSTFCSTQPDYSGTHSPQAVSSQAPDGRLSCKPSPSLLGVGYSLLQTEPIRTKAIGGEEFYLQAISRWDTPHSNACLYKTKP